MIILLATYKSFQQSELSPKAPSLECDICGSQAVRETREGYVCQDCGVVLRIQKMQYGKAYNEEAIHHAKWIGPTKIGNIKERGTSGRYHMLKRLNKYNSITVSEKTVLEKARIEINRLCGVFNLSECKDLKEMVLKKSSKIRAEMRPGTKYRSMEKLVAITLYFCLKLRNISVNPYELIENAKITKKEFRDFMLQLKQYLPEYTKRNRQTYILQRIFEVVERFELGMPLYFLCKKILFTLWDGIKNTTDDVIAGLVSSVSVLCVCKDKVAINSICTHLGIRMSTIQFQVKKNVFERFGVVRFTSLVKSSDILREIMVKLRVLDSLIT